METVNGNKNGPSASGRRYAFDNFEIDPANRTLLRDGQSVPLTGKVFDVLLAFAENPGRLLTKVELIEKVWSEDFVEEGNVARNVSTLRKALHDEAKPHKFIETVPGRGYRFVADVANGNGNGAAKLDKSTGSDPRTDKAFVAAGPQHLSRKWLWAIPLAIVFITAILIGKDRFLAPGNQIKSLAVLPLKSLDVGDNYSGIGIADAVIRKISQTGQFTVRPASAVLHYANQDSDALAAARELNTDAVLEGSVQRSGERIRVSVNLLRTSDGVSLWSDSFDMPATDIFTIQDTVAQQVASHLQLQLDTAQQARLVKRYTSNPEAYEYYLKGRANFEQRTTAIGNLQPTEAAIGYFKKAIALDPKYALAYAALGESYLWNANFNDPDNPVWVELMQQALAQADSLDPQLAETHAARFNYFFSKYGGWNLAQAAREARLALKLNPSVGHSELGTIYDHLGLDAATGLGEFQRALEIDPTNTFNQARLVESYRLFGKFDESNELSRRYFGVPDANALIGKGQFDEAESLLEISVKKSPGDLVERSFLALVLALKGKPLDAEAAIPAILQQARNNRAYHHITYNIASIYALAGKTNEAVKWLKETAATGFPNYPLFERDAHLNRIRQTPEFLQFMFEQKVQMEKYRKEFDGG